VYQSLRPRLFGAVAQRNVAAQQAQYRCVCCSAVASQRRSKGAVLDIACQKCNVKN
jgi:predicted SprT family Zn-dependent metalloprotease